MGAAMKGKALLGGLKGYATWLVITIVFPLLWLRSLRIARRHTDVVPNAPLKVGAAIVVSIVILVGGFLALQSFKEAATEGMYDSLDGRLVQATGEGAYQEAVTARDETIPGQIAIIQGRIAAEEAAGNDTAELEETLATAEADLAEARATATELTPNHELYVELRPAIEARDDARAKQVLASSEADFEGQMDSRAARAFEVKDKAMADMEAWFLWIFYPSLIGAFFAPLAFALGGILKAAFEESSTVGYKRYPGKAAGFFLLFGAFGVPSIPFAAWTFMDMEKRSAEGQIAL
jgi:hypothetical protein